MFIPPLTCRKTSQLLRMTTLWEDERGRVVLTESNARLKARAGKVENVVFITVGEPQAHADTAEAVAFRLAL